MRRGWPADSILRFCCGWESIAAQSLGDERFTLHGLNKGGQGGRSGAVHWGAPCLPLPCSLLCVPAACSGQSAQPLEELCDRASSVHSTVLSRASAPMAEFRKLTVQFDSPSGARIADPPGYDPAAAREQVRRLPLPGLLPAGSSCDSSCWYLRSHTAVQQRPVPAAYSPVSFTARTPAGRRQRRRPR